jgi:hypothetical protein
MAWFKVDDGFYTSQKVMRIPRNIRPQAIGLWLLAGTWSADKMTDGVVPAHILDEFGCNTEIFDAMIKSGLWKLHEDVKPGDDVVIVFHDWCEYQPTREQMIAKREEIHAKKVAAGKKGADVRWHGDSKRIAENSTAITDDSPVPEPVPHKNTSSPKAMSFDEFWGIWPRKEGKANAVKAYEKALKRISEPELLDKVRAYVSSPARPDVKFVPHAATWLNGERWLDDLVPAKPDIDPNWWMYPQESVSV